MVAEEEPKHECNDNAEKDDAYEGPILLLQVREDDPNVRHELLPGTIIECHLHQSLLLDEVHDDVIAGPDSVGADHRVQEEEAKEPLVIEETNALVYPNAVMVELLHAEVAHRTVFRSGWLLEGTGAALETFLEDYIVEFEAADGSVQLTLP